MEIKIDDYGYLYLHDLETGEKRYILVDMPDSSYYGKLKLSDIEDVEVEDG